jgi:hypothetical protein
VVYVTIRVSPFLFLSLPLPRRFIMRYDMTLLDEDVLLPRVLCISIFLYSFVRHSKDFREKMCKSGP